MFSSIIEPRSHIRAVDPYKYTQKNFRKSTISPKTKVAILVGTVGVGCIAACSYFYKNQFSPTLEQHSVSKSIYKDWYRQYADGCGSIGHKAQEFFFDIFENNRYFFDLLGLESKKPRGALLAFLEDRNQEAFRCTYDSNDVTSADKNILLTKVLNRYEREGSSGFVNLLIEDGANPNMQYANPKPTHSSILKHIPLLVAYEHQDNNLMTFLFEHGANPESNLQVKNKTSKRSIFDKFATKPDQHHYRTTFQELSFYNYVIQDTQKTTRKAQHLCPFKIETLKLMSAYTLPCKENVESYQCKHFRYQIPKNLKGGSCHAIALAEPYFTEPNWDYFNDFKNSPSTVLSSILGMQTIKDFLDNVAEAASEKLWNAWEQLKDHYRKFYEDLQKYREHQSQRYYGNGWSYNSYKNQWNYDSQYDYRSNTRQKETQGKYPIPKTAYEAERMLELRHPYSRKDLRTTCNKMYLRYHPDKVRYLSEDEQDIAAQIFYQIQQACEILKG